MVSGEEELNQAMHALEEFIKILVKEYPLVFKCGSGKIILNPSTQNPFFPYEVTLDVSKKK
jgi:hypothetical protein